MMAEDTNMKFACGKIGSGFLPMENTGPQVASIGKLACDSLFQQSPMWNWQWNYKGEKPGEFKVYIIFKLY